MTLLDTLTSARADVLAWLATLGITETQYATVCVGSTGMYVALPSDATAQIIAAGGVTCPWIATGTDLYRRDVALVRDGIRIAVTEYRAEVPEEIEGVRP